MQSALTLAVKMTTLDPLKSVMAIENVEDTSLALPSVNQYRSGQQRVLEQVQKVRRSKSRHASVRSGSTSLSPTEFIYDSVDSVKSPTSVYMNGNVFTGNGISQADKYMGTMTWKSQNNVKSSNVKRNSESSFYQYGTYAPIGSMTMAKTTTSRSEPSLARQRISTKKANSPQRLPSHKSTYRPSRTTHQSLPSPSTNGTIKTKSSKQVIRKSVTSSKTVPMIPTLPKPSLPNLATVTKKKEEFVSNVNSGAVEITMKEAVEYLSNLDSSFQHCGASYIQHNAYMDENAKEEVLKYNGIPLLIGLLRSSNSSVSQTACAALRNLSFKNIKAKEEIQHCNGITETVALLQETDSTEMQKQLTGLLWNLSSADSLKPDLLKNALPVLMERVILPYTTMGNNIDPEVFFHATECLRNLSSTKQSYRQTMRKCRGLVDSLVSYVKDCIDAGKPDEKSVDNCVCTLHNLTFQLEAEAPALFTRITALAKNVNRKNSQNDVGPISFCFNPPNKATEHEHYFDFPAIEEPHPSGAGWLIHSKTLQSYLTLLGSSQKEETQEACCGALQNLTLHDGIVSSVMSHTIVNKLNGLQVIGPLLKSNKVNLQRNVVALVRNLSRNPSLHNALACGFCLPCY
ncbi:plakophilin-1-like isoform X2 [Boleophthalmus pectinirostris]|uniref:plakophilin-1-like isoform X2 n=1 Tax=Boleophthalmus pectinirostris TaxID=150288 RepID=UPI00242C3191|nr:plakophilin-1-like isoform X2 [Boleophthalmus pectinirostris]